jgi:hypothetical protein
MGEKAWKHGFQGKLEEASLQARKLNPTVGV